MIKKVNIEKKVKLETQFVINEIAINCVVFGYVGLNLEVLLVKEKKNGVSKWELPSSFLENHETIDRAAERLLKGCSIRETIFLRQLNSYCDSSFSQRRMITIGYYALIDMEKYRINHLNTLYTMEWRKINDVMPQLVYNHKTILEESLMRLKIIAQLSPIALKLLPKKFTLQELMNLYKDILDIEIDKSNFRKKIVGSNLLMPLNEKADDFSHRFTRLYIVDWASLDFYDQNVLGFDF